MHLHSRILLNQSAQWNDTRGIVLPMFAHCAPKKMKVICENFLCQIAIKLYFWQKIREINETLEDSIHNSSVPFATDKNSSHPLHARCHQPNVGAGMWKLGMACFANQSHFGCNTGRFQKSGVQQLRLIVYPRVLYIPGGDRRISSINSTGGFQEFLVVIS